MTTLIIPANVNGPKLTFVALTKKMLKMPNFQTKIPIKGPQKLTTNKSLSYY